METNENSNTNKKKEKIKFYAIIIVSFIVILTILFLIEKGIYHLCKLIVFYSPFAVLVVFILHLLTLRLLVLQVIFAGRCVLFYKPTRYFNGKHQAIYIIKNLDIILSIINKFINSFIIQKECERSIKEFENALNVIHRYMSVFKEMNSIFRNLNNEQSKFLLLITQIYDDIINSKIIDHIKSKDNNNRNKEQDFLNSNSISNSHSIEISNETSSISTISINSTIMKINKNILLLKNILNDYMCINLKWYSYKNIKAIFFNELLASLSQYRIELSSSFDYEEKKMKTKDNEEIDFIIIKGNKLPNSPPNAKNNLMIICGPNGASFEHYARNINLEVYLQRGIDVLCWNYRGYGFSTGKPNFDNLRSDVIELFEHIESLNRWEKFGVHGISIGGVPCCYLANKKRDKIYLLISDRNFGSIESLIDNFRLGNILIFLYKLLKYPSSNTVHDYMKAKCKKVILNDPNDQIVLEPASLKSSVSKYIIRNYMSKVSAINNTSELELLNTRISNVDEEEEEKDYDGLDFLLENAKRKREFIDNIIDLSIMITNERLEGRVGLFRKVKKFIMEKFKKEKSHYANLKEEEIQSSSWVYEFIRNKIEEFFYNFTSGGDHLNSVIFYSTIRKKEQFIKSFFSNFLVWGSKYIDSDKDIHYFSTESIQEILICLQEQLISFLSAKEVQNFKMHPVIKTSEVILGFIKEMNNNIKRITFKRKNNGNLNAQGTLNINASISISGNNEIALSAQDDNAYESKLIKLGKGNLIHLSCGHNGSLNYEEFATFSYHLDKSEIV